jgi:tetratricopeptide (TPR) repeat protein
MPVPRLLFATTLVAACLTIVGAVKTQAAELSAAQWRQDLAEFDEAIRRDHKSPFHTVSEADYTTMVQELHDSIPTLSTQKIIVEMACIIAAVNDGHTRLGGWQGNAEWGFHGYPINLYWFQDGLFVTQARREYAETVGARVLKIGEYSAEDAQSMIERVVPADNIHGEKMQGPFYLRSPEVLLSMGIVSTLEEAPFLLEKDGRTWSPQMGPESGSRRAWTRGFPPLDADWVDFQAPSAPPLPLWRRFLDKTFWFEYIEDEKLLYVQQNQVRNSEAETLEQFYARVWKTFEDNDVEKLVLDVRMNGGGNNYLNRPALTMMVRADASAQTFTILGRRTFSACQNLVNELSRWTDTVFVGEATGERVNFYGDTRATQLTHSGLSVNASWLWWQNLDPRDTRDALYPDLAADLSSSDYATNHDPAMQLVRDYEEYSGISDVVSLIEAGSHEAAVASLQAALEEPAYRYRDFEDEINSLGYELLARQRLEDAEAVFQLNADTYPDSWNAYDSLAETVEKRGDLLRALQLFKKSVSLNPSSPSGLAAIERLDGDS